MVTLIGFPDSNPYEGHAGTSEWHKHQQKTVAEPYTTNIPNLACNNSKFKF